MNASSTLFIGHVATATLPLHRVESVVHKPAHIIKTIFYCLLLSLKHN